MRRYSILSLLICLFIIHAASGQDKFVRDLSVSEFKAALDSVSGEVLLDLRTPEELKGGIIPGAVHIDYFDKDFEDQLIALDKNKTYFIYCAGGGRSGEAKELMEKHNFKAVYNLPEGFNGWKQARMPIEKKQ